MVSEPGRAMALDHAGVSVSDLDRSHAFYRDLFGFTTVEDSFNVPGRGLSGLVLTNAAGARIELFAKEGSVPIRNISDPIETALGHGWFQVAFACPDTRREYDRLIAGGATPIKPPFVAPDGLATVAFIADPDGNLIELVERPA